jgi:hypothetical protein
MAGKRAKAGCTRTPPHLPLARNASGREHSTRSIYAGFDRLEEKGLRAKASRPKRDGKR